MVEIDKNTLDTIKVINARTKIPSRKCSWNIYSRLEKLGLFGLNFLGCQTIFLKVSLIMMSPRNGPSFFRLVTLSMEIKIKTEVKNMLISVFLTFKFIHDVIVTIYISATSTWLAHPHFEEDGTTLWFNTVHGPNSKYELVSIPPTPTGDALEGTSVVGTFNCGPHG